MSYRLHKGGEKKGSNQLDQEALKSKKIQFENQEVQSFEQKKQELHNIDLQIALLLHIKKYLPRLSTLF